MEDKRLTPQTVAFLNLFNDLNDDGLTAHKVIDNSKMLCNGINGLQDAIIMHISHRGALQHIKQVEQQVADYDRLG